MRTQNETRRNTTSQVVKSEDFVHRAAPIANLLLRQPAVKGEHADLH